MSSYYDVANYYTIFFNVMPDQEGFESILKVINPFIGVQLERNPNQELYQANIFGAIIEFYKADDFEDDGDLKLTKYGYAVNIASGQYLLWSKETSEMLKYLAINLARFIYSKTHHSCIVVRNMQELTFSEGNAS